jgi:hypothetical protein
MKIVKLYFFISFLSLLLFSNSSLGFEFLPLEQVPAEKNTQNIGRGFSIKRVFNKYNPLRLFSLEQETNKRYKVRSSISFDKKFNDPVSYDLYDSSIEDKRIQLNITVQF